MSKFVVYITYDGRHKTELEIDPNDSIRSLMTKMFNKFNIPISEKNYHKDTFTLTNAVTLLNADEDWLKKTVKEARIEEDDLIDLKDAGSVQYGE